MRLIDAGKFLNELTETFTPNDTADSVKKKVLDTLNAMSDAYDVDKVIEQFKENAFNTIIGGEKAIYLEKAINIVRKGGVIDG